MKLRKYTITLLLAGALTTLGAVAADAGSPQPDFKLKCQNGRYDAKVWLRPFKVENKCATRLTSQWVEIVFHDTDEDLWIINVASGARYTPGYDADPDFKVYASLGRGVLCFEDPDVRYVDTNSITSVYPKGSTWRATCAPDSRGNEIVVSP